MSKIIIGITDGRLFENYAHWIAPDETVELVRLGYKLKNLDALDRCTGLFLTGGEDVHPRFYQKPEYVKQFNLQDFDERRDEFELQLLSKWQNAGIPLLGVCRGMQLVNVFLGGTLIPDLPASGKFNHAKMNNKPRYHPVLVDRNSSLHSIINTDSGEISSMHHQSIDRIAGSLVTNSISVDGVIEGVEWVSPTSRTPVTLVQWHPEIMEDKSSPFTRNIRDHFIKTIEDN